MSAPKCRDCSGPLLTSKERERGRCNICVCRLMLEWWEVQIEGKSE